MLRTMDGLGLVLWMQGIARSAPLGCFRLPHGFRSQQWQYLPLFLVGKLVPVRFGFLLDQVDEDCN